MTETTNLNLILSTKELRRFRFPTNKDDEQFCNNSITTAKYNV